MNLQLELVRRSSQTATLLAAFKLKTELNTSDLMRIGTGCSSRLKELRREGHKIICQYEKPGMYRYTYLGSDEDDDSSISVID